MQRVVASGDVATLDTIVERTFGTSGRDHLKASNDPTDAVLLRSLQGYREQQLQANQ
jgi:hypothetical protein